MANEKTPLDELFELLESAKGKKQEVHEEMNLYNSAIEASTDRVNKMLSDFYNNF